MAIIDIVDSRMADLIRNLTVERGLDPRDFTIVAYGGGGSLHVGGYSREIGCPLAVIPRAAPVYSAWGISDSPILQTFATSSPTVLPVPGGAIRSVMDELLERAAQSTRSEGVSAERTQSLYVDMRYRYQLQELAVQLTTEELARKDLPELLMERFEKLYEERFGRGTTFRGAGIEISTFRLVLADAFQREADAVLGEASGEDTRGVRAVWFDDGFQTVPIYDADLAREGFRVEGPCMLEGRLMTAVIHPNQVVEVDVHGDFLIRTR